MAKKARNTATKPVASAVQTAFAALLPVFIDTQAQADGNKTATESRSKRIVAVISDLASALTREAYADACVTLFGNGVRGKENKPGSIAEALKAKGATALQVKTLLSHTRSIAQNWHKADVRKAAEESGIRAGYDAAKPPAPRDPKAPEVKAVTALDVIAAKLKTDGIDGVLAMVESACVAVALTIEAGKVHALRATIASK